MTTYTQIEVNGGKSIWMEIDESAHFVDASGEYIKLTSIHDRIAHTFQEAIVGLKESVQVALSELRKDLKPDEIEVEFGLKLAGEVGSALFVLAKATTEGSLGIRLMWKNDDAQKSTDSNAS
jgi:hypothetical protein